MKKIVLGSFLLMASSTAFAVSPGGPGCGWGNLLFKGDAGLPAHIIAWSTNNTVSGNNTLGMTSGTNGCSSDGALTYGGGKVNISGILDEFSEDVAKGEGEALNAVAVMIGVEKQDRVIFAQVTHENFEVLFPNENVTAEQVLNSLVQVLKNDPRLSKYAA
jgi:hypothetical protein